MGDYVNRLMAQLVAKTDGVPLFIEEMTQAVIDVAGSDGRLTADGAQLVTIPTTLHELLLARLDSLPESGRDVAHVGAVDAAGRQVAQHGATGELVVGTSDHGRRV